MDRRSFIRAGAGALGAIAGALTVRTGGAAPDAVQGQSAGAMALVTGPDPDMHAYVEWGPDGKVIVMPSRTPSPWFDMGHSVRGMGIPLTEFPEFDERHGIVDVSEINGYFSPALPGYEGQIMAIRAAYVNEIAWRRDPEFERAHRMRGAAPPFVSDPDPDTMANVWFDAAENGVVVPPGMETPDEMGRVWAIPRALFPEYDPAHGIVPLPMFTWSHSGDDDLALVRAAYLYALGQRTPDRPLDGNHLSVRFMPNALDRRFGGVTLNGADIFHINESYDGPDGWVVQWELGENGQPITHDDGDRIIIRKRILTGDVTHWMDGATFRPGDFTAAEPR